MRDVHAHLISRTRSDMIYTSELLPERRSGGDTYVVVSFLLFDRIATDFSDQDLVALA